MKTIVLYGLTYELTAERIATIRRSIQTYEHQIAREMRYPEDLQKPEYIATLTTAKTKLEAMLS